MQRRFSFWVWLVAMYLLWPVSPACALAESEPVLSSYYVEPSSEALAKIADLFEVRARQGRGFKIVVPQHRREELFRLVPHATLLEADISEAVRQADLRGYHTFASVESHLNQIAQTYPELAKVSTYGKSKEGRNLFALTLTGTGGGPKKEVMLTSATHGDELITVELLMGLLDKLVESYGKDSRLTALLDSRTIHFLPVINPDGYVKKRRYANGVDPNREYPWPEKPQRNPNPCIQAVMDFFDARDIRAVLDYHSAGGMYMYPWSYTYNKVPHEDLKLFDSLARQMASFNGYKYGQIPNLLYIAKGSSGDYYYWKKRSLAMGVEIAGSNTPSAGQIPHYVEQNAKPLWAFLEGV